MDAFTVLKGLVAQLDRVNVDTDQIIPKQYLKTIKRTGLREGLFSDWRYGSDGSGDRAFFLNQPRYEGATILLARDNFGCGSSREHAPWALYATGSPKIHGSFPTVQRSGSPTRLPAYRRSGSANRNHTVGDQFSFRH